MKTKLASLLLTSAAVLGTTSPAIADDPSARNTRIVGGTTAPTAAYPWIVALAGTTSDTQFCGASLIAKRWVLTASHCVDEATASDVFAYVGIHDLNNPSGQRIAVKRIILHPTWVSNFSDIALLELAEDATATPVKLGDPAAMTQIGVGTTLTVAGWGLTTDGGNASTTLNHVEVPLVDHAVCHAAFQVENNEITSEMICAGAVEGLRDSCQGDSGGPLVAQVAGQWTQFGVVSFGAAAGCAAPNFYGVYASVPVFNNWVTQHISSVSMDDSTNFGPAIQGRMTSKTLVVTNHSQEAVTLSNFAVNGTNAGDYAVGTNTCDANTLAPSAQCTVTVNLTATAAGTRTAQLSATTTSSTTTGTLNSALSGESLATANFATELDNTALTFYTGGNAAWTTENGSSQAGGSSVRAGQITDGQSSFIMTTIEGPGTLTFNWRTSSETQDIVEVFMGDTRVDSLSGEISDWIERTIAIPAGSHAVYWRYAKNGMISEGSDTAYLDNVRFNAQTPTPAPTPAPTPTPTPTPVQPLAATGGGGGGGATGLEFLGLLAVAGLRRRKR